ncbi:MAG: hypothetical protein GIKADHBN_02561 [Phycisphaerales bacterium]|nr:hypothetical protein [Phycisphaerales bacterium]
MASRGGAVFDDDVVVSDAAEARLVGERELLAGPAHGVGGERPAGVGVTQLADAVARVDDPAVEGDLELVAVAHLDPGDGVRRVDRVAQDHEHRLPRRLVEPRRELAGLVARGGGPAHAGAGAHGPREGANGKKRANRRVRHVFLPVGRSPGESRRVHRAVPRDRRSRFSAPEKSRENSRGTLSGGGRPARCPFGDEGVKTKPPALGAGGGARIGGGCGVQRRRRPAARAARPARAREPGAGMK